MCVNVFCERVAGLGHIQTERDVNFHFFKINKLKPSTDKTDFTRYADQIAKIG
jgi:hypothetical protein